MLIFQPPVNFCSDKNIQTIFGTKLEDFLNYWIDYNLISQTVEKVVKNSSLFEEFVCKLGLFHSRFKGPRVPKKVQFTHERVEYNVFLFDEPHKGSNSLKTFKISLTFRFDKL
jgi:hypothetical protein